MTVLDKNEETIFDAAVELQDPAERARFVAQACGDDLKLRREVEALLRSHDSRSLLDVPAFDLAVGANNHAPLPMEAPGTVIGRYKLLEKIGEGGMAVVYMAEQTEPIRRKVALKIIKLGMDTRQVIARFEAERQALALMDHPSIAKVLDAGATETGRPYFVMELVQGVSITEYCDKNSLNTKDRLALFLQVCNAVQHAHQKGIIHRDIKPSNVMVTHRDGKPVPKVIDFGIAKAINQKLTEKTLFTRYAHIIGTPAYMSPEQAQLSDLDIDTRSDIYSLGVLLYELLTGTTPFGEEELREAGYIEIQRMIREQEPVKPSTRIRTAHVAQPPSVGKSEGSPPRAGVLQGRLGDRSVYQQVRGDLDWIVMKSLEKDRARRYETASGLAEDIRRHLEHEPVLARGPSTTYRLRKFLRRHRVQVLVGLTVVALMAVAAIILSIWNHDRLQWNQDRLQLAEAERLQHEDLLDRARDQYARAEREVALKTIQPILDSPHVGGQARLLRAGILADNRRWQEATTILEGLFNERAEIAGAAHALMARILWESESLDAGKLQQIGAHRQKAEELLPETAEAYFLRAMTAVTVKEQLAALDKALQLDTYHYESLRLRAFTYLASRKYDRLRDDALGMTYLRPGDPLGHSLRAIALRESGKYRDAVAAYDRALALTPKEHPQHPDLAAQRGETLLCEGDYERVSADAEADSKLWADKPAFRYHRFCALTALGEYDKAAAVFQEIVQTAPTARNEFWSWATKYVFDTLEAGRSWHPADRMPAGAAFLPLMEAEDTYRDLSAKGRRLVTNGFSAQWSPDGRKLAFSLGVQGYSGVALYDPATKETELLIVPGKDPRWSPDGKYIAFVRDCQALRLEELPTTERKEQTRGMQDDEVWVMNADGTEPRPLARGGWPGWSRDSKCVYYQSRLDETLCSISPEDREARPQQIMACASAWPSVSPDGQRVAYLAGNSLKVVEMTSQALVAEWPARPNTRGGPVWSGTGDELCLGGSGLWIYRFDQAQPKRILDPRIVAGAWAPDGTRLVFQLGLPFNEVWAADLNPHTSVIETLGPGRTIAEHFEEGIALYTRRIEADPLDADAYSARAGCYDPLHDRVRSNADLRRWSALVNHGVSSGFRLGGPWTLVWAIDRPWGCQLVVFLERQEDEIHVLRIAFGQKNTCEMKMFEVPMVLTSLVSLCFLTGLDAPPARADFTFGAPEKLEAALQFFPKSSVFVTCFSSDDREMFVYSNLGGGQGGFDVWVLKRATPQEAWGPPENLGPMINTSSFESSPSISGDGLELYFSSKRPGGLGGDDLYMTRRATRTSPWDPPINLGVKVNTSNFDYAPSVSSDGLELYFSSNRPGGYGAYDIYVSRRATTQDSWGGPVNLGPAMNASSPFVQEMPRLSPDGLVLLFQGSRPGGFGRGDLWMARRANRSAPWEPVTNLGPIINSPEHECQACWAPDGSALYFAWDWSDRRNVLWKAPIIPIVDVNADAK
jgi:serine/threonine protein kinase/Tol biopolymer transport system component